MTPSILLMGCGIALAVFGVVFVRVAKRRIQALVESFGFAYTVLGLTLLMIGGASAFGNQTAIETSLVIGYAAILLATVFVLRVAFFDRKAYSAVAMLIGIVGGVLLWVWAVMQFPPHPTLIDGSLRFELAAPVLTSLAVVFLGAWVPAGLRVARVVAAQVGSLRWLVYASYAVVPVAVLAMFSSAATWPPLAVMLAAGLAMIATALRVKLPEQNEAPA
jgi:hypothetical protein